MLIAGIDVSHYQGQVDWSKARTAGISFAFIKATEGLTGKDPMFQRNWTACRNLEVLRGAYHFYRPQSDPVGQARQFLETLKDDPGEIPPVLDLESLGSSSPDDMIAGARRWMRIIETEFDCKPILYTGSAFWRFTLRNSAVFADHPLWIAHYTSGPKPLLPNAWPRWTFWQFSQQGKVPGIDGHVDLNAFNGTLPDLEAFCVRKPSPATKRPKTSAEVLSS